jgi:DNA-binding CsgD family transcriptional regulator
MAIHLGASPLIIGIAMHRALTDFSERERLLLDLLRPHLAQTYANIQAITEMRQGARLQRQVLDMHERGVIVLTKEGRVQWFSSRAQDWLTMYFGPARAHRLPNALRAWLRHQEAALSRVDDVPPPPALLQVNRDGTRLLVRHLCEADHCLLLLEERQTAPKRRAFAAGRLTRREAEVLQWVAQGKTNTEIGHILGVSVRTIQKHLEHIYEKLGVETRIAAATVALGRRLEE